jgi:N4-gp56 family major capsid protein
MADRATVLADLIDPEVMADMVSAKVEELIRVIPYAKLDTTLQGNPGSTVTIPQFKYIGDAVEVAEGEEIPVRNLETSSAEYTVKKIGIGTGFTDESVLSGLGNPIGEGTTQIAKSIASKCDWDGVDELYNATTMKVAGDIIGYNAIVEAIDAFQEEDNSEKVIFIHPSQVTQLRKDPDFISADKYDGNVMVTGEIGKIANTSVKVSKKVKVDSVTTGEGETAVTTVSYLNPIVKLQQNSETEEEAAALTVFLKKDTSIETERIPRRRKTEVTGDKHYVVALTNDSKVVILKVDAEATV